MSVEERVLPGRGLVHDVTTADGRHVGIVSLRTGQRELVFYDRHHSDRVADRALLTVEEAGVVAGLVHAGPIADDLDSDHADLEGISSRRIPIPPGSPYDGRLLGDTRARTRTGASIVAIVRGEQVVPSPRPDAGLRSGDVLVVVGTPTGNDAVTRLLATG